MDRYFCEILSVAPGATAQDIKQAYHRLARMNHPDLFPEEEREHHQLYMILLNEAYAHLTTEERTIEDCGGPQQADSFAPDADSRSVGAHRDPAYAYYKQGFVNYSRAVSGIMSLTASRNQPGLRRVVPRAEQVRHFASSIRLLRSAHGYFKRVVLDHPSSPWTKDATAKLNRIERFSTLYRRILNNLTRDSSA